LLQEKPSSRPDPVGGKVLHIDDSTTRSDEVLVYLNVTSGNTRWV